MHPDRIIGTSDISSSVYVGAQYLVFEETLSNPPKIYRHGALHKNFADAMEELLDKEERYGKYGRKFHLMTRYVPDWIEL